MNPILNSVDILLASQDSKIAELTATITALSKRPSIKDLLYKGCTARIIGHMQLWFYPGSPHTVDPTRNPGYNQHDPVFVAAHVAYIKSLGITDLMFNTYGPSSPENVSLLLYVAECQAQGMGIIVNIDKGAYAGATDPKGSILAYVTYLRAHCFGLSMYQKYDGKYIVTYFTQAGDDPAIFRAVEAANPDILFVYNDPSKAPASGGSNMAWVKSDLAANADWWIRTYGLKPGLQILCVSLGLNDTAATNGKAHAAWDVSLAPRIWPPTGPSLAVLKSYCDTINAHYSVANQPAYIQIVTINDWDEGTAIEDRYFQLWHS